MTMERGHVGTGNFSQHITFYFAAENMLRAMDLAKRMPGVKHSRMPMGKEISYEEYCSKRGYNAYQASGAKAALKGRRV